MDLGIAGKSVLITGGSRGIGFACARSFAREGARVAIVSRNPASLEAAEARLKEEGLTAIFVAADLTDENQARRAVDEIESAFGRLNILVNSAGAAKVHHPDDLDPRAYREAIEAKYFPYVYTQDAVLARWSKEGAAAEGKNDRVIVNIVGTGGKRPSLTNIASGAANAALMLSSVGLANHYARHGIRINVVNPGLTLTERSEHGLEILAKRRGISRDQAQQEIQRDVPLGRYGRPEEVAAAVLFLASAQASYIVGAVLPVDGGRFPLI